MKATKAELENRITIVLGLIAKRYTRKKIINYIKDIHADWQVKDGMIDIYCAKAREIMYEKMDRHRDEILAESINDLENLYIKAIKEDNLSEARRIIVEKTKLYDLYKGTTSTKLKEVNKADEAITDKVQTIMDKITDANDNFKPEITYTPQSELHKKTMRQATMKDPETQADNSVPIDTILVDNMDTDVSN